MRWNLRLAAASRGLWKASELQKMLAERGMVISAGKMSGLWSGHPNAVELADLDVICAVRGCEPGELLIPEPVPAARPGGEVTSGSRAAGRGAPPPRWPTNAARVSAAADGAAAASCPMCLAWGVLCRGVPGLL